MFAATRAIERCTHDAKPKEGEELGEELAVVERAETAESIHEAMLQHPVDIPRELFSCRYQQGGETPEILRANFFSSREEQKGNAQPLGAVRCHLELQNATAIGEDEHCLTATDWKRIDNWIRRTAKSQAIEEFPASSFQRRDERASVDSAADPFQNIRKVSEDLTSELGAPS
jgi:hypothetical protein